MAQPVNLKVKTFRTLQGFTAEIYRGNTLLGSVHNAPSVAEAFAMIGRYLQESQHPDVLDTIGRIERKYH